MHHHHFGITTLFTAAVLTVGTLATTTITYAEDAPATTAPADHPSQQEMMAQYMTFAQPGPEHAALAKMAGTFTAEGTNFCDPVNGPQSFTGTQTSTMILGDRFLQCDYDAEMMGMPFQGFGLTGYDNVKKQFINLWADTMGTMWMPSTGTANDDMTVFTFIGSYDDPVMGMTITMRQVITFIDDDHHRFDMFGPSPTGDGTESKMMEIHYTRQK